MRIIVLAFVLSITNIIAAQTTVKKVVLQAFWWDYYNSNYHEDWANYLADLAPRLKAMGIDAVWIPPASKNEGPGSVGYAPFDHYDLGDKYQKGNTHTRMGTKDEYLRMIAILHANGIEVIQDVVLNHVNAAGSSNGAGGQDPNSYSMASSGGYKNFRYVSYAKPATAETQTNYWNRNGRWPKNYTNFYPNQFNNCTTGDICSAWFGPDISYESTAYGMSSNVVGFNPMQSSDYMRNEARNWMMWMKKQTGVDGFRWDAVKHFPSYVQQDFSYHVKYALPSWAQGNESMFNVGEYVGSKNELDNYVNSIAAVSGEKMMGTFDFGLRGFDAAGGLYGLVYGMGNFDMASLPGAQQNERVQYYANTNTYVHRTVPFVNNHDTFRPQLSSTGNYTGWNSSSELSPHIEPNEPRMSTAYAVIFAMDGNPQVFFEDLFDIGYNGNRWSHNPKTSSTLPVRDDLVNLIWCHQALDFKSGPYQVPHASADYLVIARAGKAIIGITDSWSTWQNQWVYTGFAAGTVLKDYSGANGTATVTVDANGWAPINTPPCDPSLNIAGRHGYSVWAPVGLDGTVYNPSRNPVTVQEWEMADDLGDKHSSSLVQGGAIPASSTNFRTAGKIYVESGKLVTYTVYPENATKELYVGLFNGAGSNISFKRGLGVLTGTYTPNFTGWITIKVRNRYSTNPSQKCWVNVAYTAPQAVPVLNAMQATNEAAVWSGNGGDSFWNNIDNWEEGVAPSPERSVVIPANAFPQPMIQGVVEVNELTIEEGAHLFVQGHLSVDENASLEGEVSGTGTLTVRGEVIPLSDMQESRWSLYPNPTEGNVQLMVEGFWSIERNITIQLMTSDGRLINTYKGSLQQANTLLNDELTNCAAGIYYIRIIASDTQVLRVVKE